MLFQTFLNAVFVFIGGIINLGFSYFEKNEENDEYDWDNRYCPPYQTPASRPRMTMYDYDDDDD